RTFIDFLNKQQALQSAGSKKAFFYGESCTIRGIVRSDIFQQPNKSFHPFYFLEVNPPIDVLSSELIIEEGNSDLTHFGNGKIHIAPESGYNKIPFKELENQEVVATGKFMGGHTAWHQTKVLLWISDIQTL